MIKMTNVVVVVLLSSALFSSLFVGYTNGNNFVVAQTANSTESGPETLQDFEKEIGDDDNSAIIGNDTNISNPNNTLLDSTEVNMEEDCMVLKDGSNYCP
jgi:hypothetical protein